MPSKAKKAPPPQQVAPQQPDLTVEVVTDEAVMSADIVGQTEKTVVYKDWNGEWDWAHLNAEGEAWIHSPHREEPFTNKAAAIANAGQAFPAWPVEVVKENPWDVPVAD